MKGLLVFGVSLAVIFLSQVPHVFAHQPAFIDTQTNIVIPDADVSRAYYGELTGAPAVYTVTLPEKSRLYLNILSPYSADARKDFVVSIVHETGQVIATLSAPPEQWQEWREEFAGDTYWKGPEFKQDVPAGTYTITVSNPDNLGKYIVAPGEAEVFGAAGTIETIRQIYLLKTHFFAKPWYSLFEGIIGKMLLGMLLVVTIAISMLVRFVVVRSRQRSGPVR